VVVLAVAIARAEEPVGPAPGRIARYARGRDYHNVVGKRARRLARWLRALGHRARTSTDAEPVLERAWAARAGVGFVGKNCCLIVPGLGSHVLLATVVTSAVLAPDAPMEPRCGSCRLCLDACPTGAFAAPGRLDARRCLSYLTIEQPGPIPEEMRVPMDDRLFGCDACQDACPFDRVAPPPPASTAPFALDERWTGVGVEDLLALDETLFFELTEATPLRRPGRAGLARNAAIVLGNRGEPRRHLPVLQRVALSDPSPVVREAAGWAAARLAASAAGTGCP
jgi:epoxyqueuosine reductase